MPGPPRRLAATAALVAVLALGAGACGGEENAPGAPEGVPAAGPYTPPSGTPGVPEGASYDVDGSEWAKLTTAKRFEAATDYIEDNPGRCKGADVADVAGYVTESYGYDFPPDIPAADVLAEGCDASVQS